MTDHAHELAILNKVHDKILPPVQVDCPATHPQHTTGQMSEVFEEGKRFLLSRKYRVAIAHE